METTMPASDAKVLAPPLEQPLPQPTRLRAFWSRYRTTIITVINLSLFVALWQVVQGKPEPAINTRWIPTPFSILEALFTTTFRGKMIENFIFSGTNYMLGFLITIVLGIPVGVFLGLNKHVRKVTQTFVWIGWSTPTVAILPILTVILGMGIQAKVFLVVLATFFPIAINVLTGISTIDPSLLKAGRVFGANRWQLFTKITLPSLLPWIMTGMQIATARGLSAVVIAELYSSSKGLAYMVRLEADRFQSDKSYAAIVMLMVLSLIILNGVSWIEDRTTQWRAVAKI
jgi:ABC-type nitrate/sulfonate/bicarbonate transport system permease component